MVVVGNIDKDLLQKELESVLGKWDQQTENRIVHCYHINKTKRKVFIINKPGAVQTEIRTGHLSSKRNEKDFFQKQIINMILGGQFSSRLNLNLQRKEWIYLRCSLTISVTSRKLDILQFQLQLI